MNTIIAELVKNKKFLELTKSIEESKGPVEISGLTDVSGVAFISAIYENTKRPIMIITYNEIQAKKIAEDIKYFTEKVRVFPKKEIVTYDYIAESKDLPYERIETLNKIYDNKNLIIVTTIEAVEQKIISKKELYKNVLKFKIGQRCNLEELKQKLVDLGYVRYELIDGRGEFSVRGGIIDISISENTGVRIELWGDEIDSIRYFNIVSQRSTSQIENITIHPAHEFILEKSIDEVINQIRQNIYEGKKLEILENDIEEIKNGNYISKIDRYFNSFYSKQETILDYLSDKYIVFLDEVSKIKARSENIKNDNNNLTTALLEKDKIVPESIKNIVEYEDIQEILNHKQAIYIEKTDKKGNSNIEKYNFKYRDLNYFKSELDILINDINKFLDENKNIYILLDMKEKTEKIKKILEENQIQARIEENLNQTIVNKTGEKYVTIAVGKLSSGFEAYDLQQVVIVADELISTERKLKKHKREEFKQGEKVVFADLKVGDYVVHRNYGIGIYIGVNTITADGTTKDYIKIKYLDDDILYIPTNALDSIRKYVGGE